jgi:cell division protein FtsQ
MQPLTRNHRRDPAPSRWSYRMQRLWLTPMVRAAVRIGMPLLLIGGPTLLYLADADRRATLMGAVEGMKEDFQTRPEFMVSLVAVEGAGDDLAAAIRSRLNLNLPLSSFDLDLEAAQARIQTLDAVQATDLRIRAGGVLQVVIVERTPALVWRRDDGLDLLDASGHRVASLAARADRADLPLVAGEGADAAAAEALAILQAAQPFQHRIRGLVRMGQRRWDIVLDRDMTILLPEAEPINALTRFLAIDGRDDILNRDIAAVDLRLGQRPVLRLTPFATLQMRRGRGLAPTETDL